MEEKKKIRIENGRVYLTVPYSEKEFAKKMGCRWDANEKQWWCHQDRIPDMKDHWLGFKRKVKVSGRMSFDKEKDKEIESRRKALQEPARFDQEDFIFNGRYWYRQTADLDIWAEGGEVKIDL